MSAGGGAAEPPGVALQAPAQQQLRVGSAGSHASDLSALAEQQAGRSQVHEQHTAAAGGRGLPPEGSLENSASELPAAAGADGTDGEQERRGSSLEVTLPASARQPPGSPRDSASEVPAAARGQKQSSGSPGVAPPASSGLAGQASAPAAAAGSPAKEQERRGSSLEVTLPATSRLAPPAAASDKAEAFDRDQVVLRLEVITKRQAKARRAPRCWGAAVCARADLSAAAADPADPDEGVPLVGDSSACSAPPCRPAPMLWPLPGRGGCVPSDPGSEALLSPLQVDLGFKAGKASGAQPPASPMQRPTR